MVTDIHGVPIDPLWAAEFRGFFLGEGSLEIGLIHHTTTWRGRKANPKPPVKSVHDELRPRARICQRDDSRAVLDAIQSRLGGHTTKHNKRLMVSPRNGKDYISNATIAWYVMNGTGIQRVLDLLKGGLLPHSKLREVAILEAFLRLRPKIGRYWVADHWTQGIALMAELRAVREYPPTVLS